VGLSRFKGVDRVLAEPELDTPGAADEVGIVLAATQDGSFL
jgi:hypothetical protein